MSLEKTIIIFNDWHSFKSINDFCYALNKGKYIAPFKENYDYSFEGYEPDLYHIPKEPVSIVSLYEQIISKNRTQEIKEECQQFANKLSDLKIKAENIVNEIIENDYFKRKPSGVYLGDIESLPDSIQDCIDDINGIEDYIIDEDNISIYEEKREELLKSVLSDVYYYQWLLLGLDNFPETWHEEAYRKSQQYYAYYFNRKKSPQICILYDREYDKTDWMNSAIDLVFGEISCTNVHEFDVFSVIPKSIGGEYSRDVDWYDNNED